MSESTREILTRRAEEALTRALQAAFEDGSALTDAEVGTRMLAALRADGFDVTRKASALASFGSTQHALGLLGLGNTIVPTGPGAAASMAAEMIQQRKMERR